MSYGLGRSRLSDCHAKLLAVHPYFNSDVPLAEGLPPDLEVISGRGFQEGSKTVTIQTRVSDVGGLHQVLLLVETRAPHIAEGFDEVISCQGVAGKLDAVVTFEFDGMIPSGGVQSLADSVAHPVLLRTVDNDGNAREVSFVLVEVSNNRIATLASHSSVVTSVAYSPDGETLASGSHDSMVKTLGHNDEKVYGDTRGTYGPCHVGGFLTGWKSTCIRVVGPHSQALGSVRQ